MVKNVKSSDWKIFRFFSYRHKNTKMIYYLFIGIYLVMKRAITGTRNRFPILNWAPGKSSSGHVGGRLNLTFRVQWRKACPRCDSRFNSWIDGDTTGFGLCGFGWFTNTIWFILIVYGSICLLFTWNIKRYYTWTYSNYVNVGCSILQATGVLARTVSSNGINNRSNACSSADFSNWCNISRLRLGS